MDSVNNEGIENGTGFRMTVNYNKKYGDFFNPYEEISITVESKNVDLNMFYVKSISFDNNDLVLSKDDAINRALEEDKKIQMGEIESTDAKLMIVKMNADAYDRINDKEKYYKSKEANIPNESINYYSVEDKVRKAWVVVINYVDNPEFDEREKFVKGKYSYFVDATTGEIIGGHVGNYIYTADLLGYTLQK